MLTSVANCGKSMGTAVLLPHDCLPLSKSRCQNFSDVLYGSESSPRARGSAFQVLDPSSYYYLEPARSMFAHSRGVNWSGSCGHLPLPPHGSASLHMKSFQKEAGGKKIKARRPMEPRDAKLAAKSGLDVPVVTILQRPKEKDAADKLIAKFLVKVDEVNKARNGARHADSKADEFMLRNGIRRALLDMKKGGSYLKKGTSDLKTGPKFHDAKLDVVRPQVLVLSTKLDRSSTSQDSKIERGRNQMGASKPVNVARRDGSSRPDDLEPLKGLNQMLSRKVAGEHKSLRTAGAAENFSCKLAYTNQPTTVDGGGPARLRRASTDPQVVKQLVNQYRSAVMEIPSGETKSYHGFTRTTSMSCPERWAGPAYSSSPAPSSLPLPKFSLPNQKASSLDSVALFVEQHRRNITQPPEVGSMSLLPGFFREPELDVASATKSLRRMLKLDPF